jgi:hypothetical protein
LKNPLFFVTLKRREKGEEDGRKEGRRWTSGLESVCLIKECSTGRTIIGGLAKIKNKNKK